MPRFHFHVYDGYTARDPGGIELPNYEAARRRAIALAGELMMQEASTPRLGEEWRIEVTDDTNLVLLRLDFSIAESSAVAKRRA